MKYDFAVIGAGPDEKNLDTGSVTTAGKGNDIRIWQVWQVDILIGLNAGQRADPVAPDCGCFKLQLVCGAVHAGGIFTLYFRRAAGQEPVRLRHLFGIVTLCHLPDTGRGAALDLILQAGPCAAGKDRV